MKKIIIVLLCFISNLSIAQDFPYWNKVSTEDLKMDNYEVDTSAAAVYLLNYGKTRFGIFYESSVYYYDYHYQVKILKKSAFNEANIKFTYFKKYPIQNVKAVIHNWENGKRVTTEVTEIFDKKLSKYRNEKSLTFPNLKVGSVIEYRFTYIGRNFVSPQKFYFQKKYPVQFSEYHFAFQTLLSYKPIYPKLKYSLFRDSTYYIRPSGYESIQITEYWMQYRDIPALLDEPYVNNIYNYRNHLSLQLASYIDGRTGKEKQFISSWEKLGEFYRDDDDAGKQYNNPKNLKATLSKTDVLLANKTTEKDKVIALFDYVQNTIEWDEEYSIFKDKNFKKTIAGKSGNAADINLLLLALLKHYEIEANPVLISTQDEDQLQIYYPFLGQFNHVILQVIADEKTLYLDAISPEYTYDVLPQNSICLNGFLITDNSQEWIDIPQKAYTSIIVLNSSINEDLVIKVNMKKLGKSYAASEIREEIEENGKEEFKVDLLKDLSGDYQLLSFEQKDLKVSENPIEITVILEVNDAIQGNETFLYFNPLLNLGFEENPFKNETRTLPIELPYSISDQIISNIEIPKGYTIEELPKDAGYTLPNKAGSLLFMAKQTSENSIQVISKFKLNNQYFDPETYATIKEFFALVVESHNQQVVLKKVE